MLEPRTRNLQGTEQGAQRAAAVGLERERRPAVRARRARVGKGVNLLLEEGAVEGAEQVCGLGQGQSEMCDALVVLGEGDDIGDGFFMTLIVTNDELQFDAHRGTSPGSSDK